MARASSKAVIPIRAAGEVLADPRGRVDVLLVRVGELLTRRLERGLAAAGVPVGDLWGGSDGVKTAIELFCQQQGLAGVNVLSPVDLAERAGAIKRRGGRRRA